MQQIEDSLADIMLLCKLHNVQSMSIFGSAASNTMKENSDVDFLVDFHEDLDVMDYSDNYFSLLENLEKLIGRKIDLVSKKSLKNPILIEEIDRSKVELYAA